MFIENHRRQERQVLPEKAELAGLTFSHTGHSRTLTWFSDIFQVGFWHHNVLLPFPIMQISLLIISEALTVGDEVEISDVFGQDIESWKIKCLQVRDCHSDYQLKDYWIKEIWMKEDQQQLVELHWGCKHEALQYTCMIYFKQRLLWRWDYIFKHQYSKMLGSR